MAPAPVRVGVFPAAELERRRALLAALELAHPVRFEARGPAELRDLDGALEFGAGAQAATAASVGIPALALLVEEEAQAGPTAAQTLATAPELDRRLRAAVLPDSRLGAALAGAGGLAAAAETVLGRCDGEPTWLRAGLLNTALLAPAELGAGEPLRARLGEERSAALLPLVHFLRELSAPVAWQPPPARATMLFDDPNLHWPSYGYVDLPALAAHAREHGYHAALATIPLDAWFAHPGALRALAASAGSISLLVHGNDHDGGELGRAASEREALGMAAQALRRIGSFERRTGVTVDRVMVPPHEKCSEATVAGLRRCGFEAITMTLPFPWLESAGSEWLQRPPAADVLTGWRAADFSRGLPLLLRHPLGGRSGAELALRAYLDQPLILYGHHDDLLEGLDVLGAAAAEVERLGRSHWCSLGEIAAGNFETRLDGTTLALRLLGSRAEFEAPEAAGSLVVELPPSDTQPELQRLFVDGRPAGLGVPLAIAPGARVRIELRAADAVDAATVPAPRRRPLALPRRLASEGRDRLLPLLARAR